MQPIIPIPFVLSRGHSDNPADGTCAMAAVAWIMHGQHTDAPDCACPVIAQFVIPANDAMSHATRQRLIPYLHRIAGSRSPEHEAARVRIMWLAAVRVFAPRALDAAGLHDHAAALRALPDDVTPDQAEAAAEAAAAAAARAEAEAEAEAEAAAEAAWAAAWADAEAAAEAAWAAAAARAAAAAARAAAEAAAAAAAAEAAAALAVARAEAEAAAWNDYFVALNDALNAGPQGEPWSADEIETGHNAYRVACAAA